MAYLHGSAAKLFCDNHRPPLRKSRRDADLRAMSTTVIDVSLQNNVIANAEAYLKDNEPPAGMLTEKGGQLVEIDVLSALGLHFWRRVRDHAFKDKNSASYKKGGFNRAAPLTDFVLTNEEHAAWEALYGEPFGQTPLIVRKSKKQTEPRNDFVSSATAIFGATNDIGPRVFATGTTSYVGVPHQFLVAERLEHSFTSLFNDWEVDMQLAGDDDDADAIARQFVDERIEHVEALSALFSKAAKRGFVHGDGHSNNIMYTDNPDGSVKMRFIDLDSEFLFVDTTARYIAECIYVAQLAMTIIQLASLLDGDTRLRKALAQAFNALPESPLARFLKRQDAVFNCEHDLRGRKALDTVLYFFTSRLKMKENKDLKRLLKVSVYDTPGAVTWQQIVAAAFRDVAPRLIFER